MRILYRRFRAICAGVLATFAVTGKIPALAPAQPGCTISLVFFAITDSSGWRPGIGDNTFLGWFTVLAYFAAAAVAYFAYTRESGQRYPTRTQLQTALHTFRSPSALDSPKPLLWLLLTLILLLLGLNKQLDLQSFLTGVGRSAAREGGWYEHRRLFQFFFVLFIFLAGLAALAATAWYLRNSLRRYRLALIGLTYLIFFVILRAASFHHVDILLKSGAGGIHLNHLLELAGIVTIAWSAYAASQTPTHPKLQPFERVVRVR